MIVSATYICPVRGIAGLEPPHLNQMAQAAKAAKDLGLERLFVPILEEALSGLTKAKIRYLDGLISALDRMADVGMAAWLIAPAQRVLGLNFLPPHLVRGGPDSQAVPVFVDGKIRNLRAYDWWKDPPYVQKRIRIFHELVDAVTGHPALSGWLVMDRALEWVRPDLEVADLVLRSYLAEIRDHDEGGGIYLGLGWSELLRPEMAQTLAQQVEGVRMSGFEMELAGLGRPKELPAELFVTAYLGTLAEWLFQRPIETEIGWGALNEWHNIEEIVEGTRRLAGQGIAGVNWWSLVDPEPGLLSTPPWVLEYGLEHVGLLDNRMEPKDHVETWFRELLSSRPEEKTEDFIDISLDEYLTDPVTHLPRLWEHFKESCGYHAAAGTEKRRQK
ncbi:MAG: hypothetical protein JW896_16735 [Deltaproteobacteria bacterium]|nr:hypothetical protein [Deltaproteobacteria bacterium]